MTMVTMQLNGKQVSHYVDDNMLLVEFLREELRLTGTHVGCDTSQCGACTVHLNGKAVKACTTLASTLDGAEITTIEGIAGDELHPMQQSFNEHHGLQCG
ncbi:MAG: 2Fe-2S iron-sulfur cluster-binding protein, partial [Pseudomonadota bacterium]